MSSTIHEPRDDTRQPVPEIRGESPPIGAFATEQQLAAGDDLNEVLRVWFSGIRPNFRRSVQGRATLQSGATEAIQHRRLAR